MINKQISQKKQKLYYRRNGFIVEFLIADRFYWLYILRRFLQFVFDTTFFVVFLFILYGVFKLSLFTSSLLAFGINFALIVFWLIIFDSRTVGMLIAQLRVAKYDGAELNLANKITRAIFSAIYVLPIIGWLLLITTGLSILLTRGISPVDLITRTQIITLKNFNKYQKIYKELDNGSAIYE